MQTYANSHAAHGWKQRQHTTQSLAWGATLLLWLPIVAIGLAMFTSQHHLEYAMPGYGEGQDQDASIANMGSSSALRQLSFLTFGFLGVLLLIRPSELPVKPRLGLLTWLLALCGWVIFSAGWSDDTALTVKRTIVPVLMIVGALGLAKQWQPREVCLFTALYTSLVLLLGIGAECVTGAFLRADDYRFAGTLHPNSQAVHCAALSLASLALVRDRNVPALGKWKLIWYTLFALGVTFLLLTKSRTATMAFLVALLTFYFMGASLGRQIAVLALLAMVVGAVALIYAESEDGVEELLVGLTKMGREQETESMASLTGRIPIWKQVMRDVGEQPWRGYGYGAFWTPRRVLEYSYIHNWALAHAHSAYLETLLNIGAIGLALGLAVALSTIRGASRAYRETGDSSYRFVGAVMVMALVQGLLDFNFVGIGFELTLAMICVSTVLLHGKRAAMDGIRVHADSNRPRPDGQAGND